MTSSIDDVMAPSVKYLLRSQLSSTDHRVNILMVGPPGAGKTTILSHLGLAPIDTTLPVDVDIDVEFQNIKVARAEIAQEGRTYLADARGLIFVVDSTSTVRRLAAEKDALHTLLSEEELKDVVILVFSNKKDCLDARTATQICDILDLQKIHQRHWHVKSTCATTGDGLIEGIHWLLHKMQNVQQNVVQEILGHVFHPNRRDCISMLSMLRLGQDMGFDVVKPKSDLYNDHPRVLFGKMTPNIILKGQHCVSYTRSKAKTGGYIRTVTTGGHWKANGSKSNINDEDKGVSVGYCRRLTFVNTKEVHTCWWMREFDTWTSRSCQTICIVFNSENEVYKLYKTLRKAATVKPEENEGNDAIVAESSLTLKSKTKMSQQTRSRTGVVGRHPRHGPTLIYDFIGSDEEEEEEEMTEEARGKQLSKGKQKAPMDLLPPKKRYDKPEERLSLSRSLRDSGIPKEVYMESLKTSRRNAGESSSRSSSFVYQTRSRVKEKKEINVERGKAVKALDWSWGRTAATADAVETLLMLQGQKKGKHGVIAEKFLSWLSANNEKHILMVGLPGSGKRTILTHLNLDPHTESAINFTVRDVGPQIPSSWMSGFKKIWGLVYVVDVSSGLLEAKDQLQSMLNKDELTDACILVLANKKDLPNATNAAEIPNLLDLLSIRQPNWHVESTCAVTGEGLYEGVEWLYGNIG